MQTGFVAKITQRRNVVGGAGAAIASQGVVAASSLALQMLALSRLGNQGLAIFALLVPGIMVTATALHTGWIGDPLVLLDRHDPSIRRALVRASAISVFASYAFGFVGALIFTDVSVKTAAIFGAAQVVWLIEETGRRLLMARLEFVKLLVNDIAYAVVAVGAIIALMTMSTLTMDWVLIAMLSGSIASAVTAVIQLPREELRLPSPGPAAWRTLFDVSVWRSGQLMMRPFGMLLVRWSVSYFVSAEALGVMEAGRLVIAPILTAAIGIGGFTLPFFTRRRDQGTVSVPLIAAFTTLSALVAVLYIPVALAISGPFERISNSDPIPLLLTASWSIYAVAYAANVPVANALTALLYSKQVLVGRVIDSAFIVVMSIVVVHLDGVRYVPLVMTAGILVGTALPVLSLKRKGIFDDPAHIAPAELAPAPSAKLSPQAG